jgi:hypothetical protein
MATVRNPKCICARVHMRVKEFVRVRARVRVCEGGLGNLRSYSRTITLNPKHKSYGLSTITRHPEPYYPKP